MADDLFAGSEAKVRRAERLVHELEACLQQFLQNGACSVEIHEDAATGSHTLKVVASKPLPEDIPLIIGDAANNLRSSLDILISAFVRKAGGNIAAASLPIHETRENLEGSLQRSEIHRVRPDIAQFVLNDVKPYKDGNFSVWALSKLDNVNKHRLVIPVLAVTRLSGISARDENNNTFSNMTVTVDHGGAINLVRTGARMHITNPGQPAIAVLFDQGHPFEGRPVVRILQELVPHVSNVIQAFRRFALTRHSSGRASPAA
jgi:hypothetical protein